MVKLAIVSPCYNEEEVLKESASRLELLFQRLIQEGQIDSGSFVLFVNDGSRDNTWRLIKELHMQNPMFRGLCLAHNVGHQHAIMAGMMKVRDKCDAAITIDADLQDELNAIPKMLEEFEAGNEIVYGVKENRTADSLMKRVSAQAFYRLQKSMGVDAVYNHADFRLMSKRALDYLAQFPERNLYLRGIIPMIGLKNSTVKDVISSRSAGTSKYTIGKMFRLALDGITSFSTTPIKWIIGLGCFSLLFSLVMIVHVLIDWWKGNVVPGWSEIMISVWLIGGIIILSIGIVGEYIGKIYWESKQRPLWLELEYIE